MTRTCALCGARDATTYTDVDGRTVPACAVCVAPVPDPARPYEPADPIDRFDPAPTTRRSTSTRAAVFAVLRAAPEPLPPNAIATALGVPCPGTAHGGKVDRAAWRPYEAVLACLARAARRGEVSAEWINPGAPRLGRRYHLTPEATSC